LDLPRKAYAYSQLVLVFEVAGKGANAIVSELNLYSSNSKAPVPFKGKEKEALGNVLTYQLYEHDCPKHFRYLETSWRVSCRKV
jgi:hypothetical protein